VPNQTYDEPQSSPVFGEGAEYGDGGKKAVALLYDKVNAPVVKAKGQGELAWDIIRAAQSHGVHVAEDPVLAETLSYLQLEEEIPEELYRSVAVLLSWVYWLSERTPWDD
tara:strand:- start:615 stop:944 length:330 start_codon:yes stop_codon:yes gene_type:complete